MQRVVCAAVKVGFENGHTLVIPSPRHYDMTCHAILRMLPPTYEIEQGFVDQRGVFLSRAEALEIAKETGQILKRCGGDDRELFSENLY